MKKTLALFLAGLLSVGCFAACDEEKTENNKEILNGEVTEQQWVVAFKELDLFNYLAYSKNENIQKERTEITEVYMTRDGGKLELIGRETTVEGYRKEIVEEKGYGVGYTRTFDECDFFQYTDKWRIVSEDESWFDEMLSNDYSLMSLMFFVFWEIDGIKELNYIVESAVKNGQKGYDYNEDEGFYATAKEVYKERYDQEVVAEWGIWREVEFVNGTMEIRQYVEVKEGENTAKVMEKYTFQETVVDLPAQDELDELWLGGIIDEVCDECKEEKAVRYYNGKKGDIGIKGEYCNACAYKKDPTIFGNGKCDDCGAQEDLYYLDGSEEYYGIEGEYCADCAAKRMMEEIL